MGAPKQKWTSEEEAALKAGIQKYGTGKWSTILKDPEFSKVLQSRSNVDLKDKWRNLSCMANGMGSRHKGRVSNKNNQQTAKQDEDTIDCSSMVDKDTDGLDVTSHAASSSEISQDTGSRKQISRLDDHILESITKLKEPRGSSRSAIAQYIEEHYLAPPDLERTLAVNLKTLTENGLLVKVKHQYRIAPRSITFASGEGSRKHVIISVTKAKIDGELEKMKSMSAKEAAAAAAQAVAEAEAAIAEAEEATREAEEAEAEAEAAKCFADAARKALNSQTITV